MLDETNKKVKQVWKYWNLSINPHFSILYIIESTFDMCEFFQ